MIILIQIMSLYYGLDNVWQQILPTLIHFSLRIVKIWPLWWGDSHSHVFEKKSLPRFIQTYMKHLKYNYRKWPNILKRRDKHIAFRKEKIQYLAIYTLWLSLWATAVQSLLSKKKVKEWEFLAQDTMKSSDKCVKET